MYANQKNLYTHVAGVWGHVSDALTFFVNKQPTAVFDLPKINIHTGRGRWLRERSGVNARTGEIISCKYLPIARSDLFGVFDEAGIPILLQEA